MLVVAFLAYLSLQTTAAPPREGAGASAQTTAQGVLKGRVVDEPSGKPIKGVTVSLYQQGESAQPPPATSTDSDGRWEIRELPWGEYHVGATKPGYINRTEIDVSIGLTSSRPERTIDLTLARGAVISGRITDGDGEPLPGLQVMVLLQSSTGNGYRWDVATGGINTDDRGEFRLYGLYPGDYILAAQPENSQQHTDRRGARITPVVTYFPGTTSIDEAQRITLDVSTEFSDLTFPLQVALSISVHGRVVPPPGASATSMAMLMPQRSNFEPYHGNALMATVTPSGVFAINGVPAGRYRLIVRVDDAGSDQRTGELDIVAAEEDLNDVVVTTRGPTLVRGRVILAPAEATASGPVRVSASPIGSGGHMIGYEGGIVRPDGTFELKVYHSPIKLSAHVQAEPWALSAARWKGHDVSGGLNFELGETVDGVELTLRQMTSQITGTVDGVGRGDNDREGTVMASRVDDEERPFGDFGVASMVPIREGRFTMPRLAAGEYRVVAVRTLDRQWFAKPDLIELLKARATSVTVADRQTKTVNLTLIADY